MEELERSDVEGGEQCFFQLFVWVFKNRTKYLNSCRVLKRYPIRPHSFPHPDFLYCMFKNKDSEDSSQMPG